MSEENKEKGNAGKRKPVIAILAVIIVVLAIAVVLLLPKGGTAKKVAKQLSLGAKYLSELEYEQAIAAYELAIEIDPKCVDAYLELADIYSELGEYDKAEEILKKAKREVAEEEVAQIRRKQEKIEKKRKEAEGTPEPTNEPKPTAEPVQTPEPTATQTPEPTATPTPKSTATPTPEPTDTPTPKPTATPTPKPTPKPTATPTPTPEPTKSVGSRVTITGRTVELENAEVGDYVTFGTYEQDNNLGNGAEAIEWIVLDKQDGKVLLLSKYALDAKPYNDEWIDVTWETCTLRSWINSEFYCTAFSEKERTSIAETLVRNADNPEYGTEGGNDTRDKVFLLSIEEVMTYFDADPDAEDPVRRAKLTKYAKEQAGWGWDTSDEYYVNGDWWLRSPGFVSNNAAYVDYNGNVNRGGYLVDNYSNVVRPALWIAY